MNADKHGRKGKKESLMTLCHYVHGLFALFLCVFSTRLLAEDRSVPPSTITPAPCATTTIAPFTPAIVVEMNKSTREITYKWPSLRSVFTTQAEALVVADVRTIRYVPETVTAKFPLGGFLLYDTRGNKLAVDDFVSRVKAGDVILVCEGGRLPDAPYLRVFKDDTLILVRGKADTPPIPVDPNLPPGYVPHVMPYGSNSGVPR
jgi:hypothetical protein